jgi:predicted membrane protein
MEKVTEENSHRPNNLKKVILGLIVIALGALLLADNFEGLSYHIRSIVFSFPMLIIAIGILNLFGRKSYVTGLILIMVGIFFLIPKVFYGIAPDFTRLFWPIILIAIGILIIARRSIRNGHNHFHHHHCGPQWEDSSPVNNFDNYIDEVNIFGGGKKRITAENFKGGKITSIFGGSELDLTNAKLAEGTNVIDMVCIFGGSSIIIPADWDVRSEVVSILGGFADKRLSISTPVSKDRVLLIKGVAIFGGGEIKSV